MIDDGRKLLEKMLCLKMGLSNARHTSSAAWLGAEGAVKFEVKKSLNFLMACSLGLEGIRAELGFR